MEESWRAFKALMENYEEMLAFVLEQAGKCAVPEKKLMKLQLGFEEAVVNVIHYAYQDQEPGDVRIGVWRDESHFFLAIADDGHVFNPLEKESRQRGEEAEIGEVPIGGLGIFFLRKCFQELRYAHVNGDKGNLLTMVLDLG